MNLTARTLGHRITLARRSSFRSLGELAAELDLPYHLLHCFERGLRWPRLDTLIAIARTTGYPLIWFIDEWMDDDTVSVRDLEECETDSLIRALEKTLTSPIAV